MRALVISADGFEDMELFYPVYRLKEDGWDVTLASPSDNTITGKHGYTITPDITVANVVPEDYDLLVIPGGKAPEAVRSDRDALALAGSFMDARKPVAAICHGPQVLISAGVMKGRRATCWESVKDELVAAGARYTDNEVVLDGNLVTSRMPDDLPAFMRETLKLANKSSRRMAA